MKMGMAGSQRCAWSQEPGFEVNDRGLRFLACKGDYYHQTHCTVMGIKLVATCNHRL